MIIINYKIYKIINIYNLLMKINSYFLLVYI